MHIWSPPSARADVERLTALLSAEELARAGRLEPSARAVFVASRAGLRRLLGPLCGADAPERVPLQIDARGKPFLPCDAVPGLHFGVSHSDGLIACAVTLGHTVGIDIEREQEGWAPDAIARYCFAPEETRALRRLPAGLRRRAFYAAWTRKEALLKASGEGLARGLDRVVVAVDPDRPAVLATDQALGPPGAWTLLPVPLPDGYQGSVAVRRRRAVLHVARWPAPPAACP